MPPRLLWLSKYALPSLPNASTNCEGVAPFTVICTGPQPPRSMSPLSSDSQLVGAQESIGFPLKTGPGRKRITASPPPHWPPVWNVFPVMTNTLRPPATPPCPQIPPPRALGAHAVTLAGLLLGPPTPQPR